MKPTLESAPASQHEKPPSQDAPQVHAMAEEPASRPARVYQPPAVLWEHPFVALAQISTCPIPGESECVP